MQLVVVSLRFTYSYMQLMREGRRFLQWHSHWWGVSGPVDKLSPTLLWAFPVKPTGSLKQTNKQTNPWKCVCVGGGVQVEKTKKIHQSGTREGNGVSVTSIHYLHVWKCQNKNQFTNVCRLFLSGLFSFTGDRVGAWGVMVVAFGSTVHTWLV